MDRITLDGHVRAVWCEPARIMGHGYLGPWVTFGSTDTTEPNVPSEWVKVVTTVGIDVVDKVVLYSETIVEKGQTDRSNKQ